MHTIGWLVVAKEIRFAPADEEVILGNMKAKDSAVGLLGAVMEPLGCCLNAESARRILNVRAGPAAVRRLAQLARKCDRGQLTPQEQAEYQLYVEVGDCVAVLQAKARRVLAGRMPMSRCSRLDPGEKRPPEARPQQMLIVEI